MAFLAAAIVSTGCNSDVTMTKEQEDAARHPVASPAYQGHAPGSDAKMQQSIADFNKRHQNDKVEFTK